MPSVGTSAQQKNASKNVSYQCGASVLWEASQAASPSLARSLGNMKVISDDASAQPMLVLAGTQPGTSAPRPQPSVAAAAPRGAQTQRRSVLVRALFSVPVAVGSSAAWLLQTRRLNIKLAHIITPVRRPASSTRSAAALLDLMRNRT